LVQSGSVKLCTIVNGIWKNLSDLFYFDIGKNGFDVILGYLVSVQPQSTSFFKDRKQEYVSCRILVDGVPYNEGKKAIHVHVNDLVGNLSH
jgi:hypothetical protein